MGYRNECLFMKTAGDSGNAALGPDLADPEPTINEVSQTTSSSGHETQSWSGAEQSTSLPTRARGSGSAYVPLHGMMPPDVSIPHYNSVEMDTGSTNDMSSTSPDAGQSSRPTPNSSAASEHSQNLVPGSHNVGGVGSGRNSFTASPIPSHPSLNMPETSQSEAERSVNSFFGDPTSFNLPSGMATGLSPDQRFSMPETPGGGADFSGWAAQMSSQAGMTPGVDGVLRSIMAMSTMDTMDIAWEPNS